MRFNVGQECGAASLPVSGPEVASQFKEFAASFTMPGQARYVSEPAVTNELGVKVLPPPPADPLRSIALGAASIAAALYLTRRMRGRGSLTT